MKMIKEVVLSLVSEKYNINNDNKFYQNTYDIVMLIESNEDNVIKKIKDRIDKLPNYSEVGFEKEDINIRVKTHGILLGWKIKF